MARLSRFLILGVLALAAVGASAQEAGLLWSHAASRRVDAVAVSADGGSVAIGSRDNVLAVYDGAGGLRWKLDAPNSILGVSLSADASRVAVACEDRLVYFLDGAGGRLWTHEAGRPVTSAAVSADGTLVVAASDDRSFVVLDAEGGELWRQEPGVDVGSVAVYGAGTNCRVLAGTEDGNVSIYSRTGELLLQAYVGWAVEAVDATANGALVAVGGGNGTVYLVDGSNGSLRWSFRTGGAVHGVAISDDGRFVAAGSEDGDLYLLDGAGKLRSKVAQGSPVLGVALSADGRVTVVGTASGAGRVYDRVVLQAATGRRDARRWIALAAVVVAALLIAGGLAVAVRRTERGKRAWRRASAAPRAVVHAMWRARLSYLLILPTVALLLLFNYYPALSGLFHAFTEWKPGGITTWTGLDNFRYMLKDRYFWVGFWNMAVLVVTGVLKTLTFPLIVAELLFHIRSGGGRYWMRTLFIVPIVLPGVVEILLWNNIYDPEIGLLNQTLSAVGLASYGRVWYGDPRVALGSIIFIGFPWVAAFPLLVFYGGLINIPSELFDAARVDGVGSVRRFWYVDLPLLMSQVKLLLILTFIGGVQTFELVYLTTGGGPGMSTYTPGLELYYSAMRLDKLGYASAIGMVLFVIILAGTIVNLRAVKSSVEYQA